MEDYIKYHHKDPNHHRQFNYEKSIGKLRVFKSSDNSVRTSVTLDCIFILDPEQEIITKYKFKNDRCIDENSAEIFRLDKNFSLKKLGYPTQDVNLNLYFFNSYKKDKDESILENLTYYTKHTPEELKAFIDVIFINRKPPYFKTRTIIRYFKDGGITNTDEKIKNNIYKYVLLPDKRNESFKLPNESELKHIKTIKTENVTIYEHNTINYPPKEYSDDVRIRFKQNIQKLKKEYLLFKTYDELKKWIKKTKIKEPRVYGFTIGTESEPVMKRYFSKNAYGYYFYKDIVIKFSVDGYGDDFVYEFKTCKKSKIKENLEFAKNQANLYAYFTNKDKIIIEIFSYEEDKIYYYEFKLDRNIAKEKIEKFYADYKKYLKMLVKETNRNLNIHPNPQPAR